MLFGYDIGVISGAENLLKADFGLSSGTEELAVAAVLIGAVIGAVIGGPWPTGSAAGTRSWRWRCSTARGRSSRPPPGTWDHSWPSVS